MKIYTFIDDLFNDLKLKDGVSLSFHHHLRNGDFVVNAVMDACIQKDLKHLKLYPSAIFPSYEGILTALKDGRVDKITTNYINGPVANYLAKHKLKEGLTMQTHGGRARAFIEGENQVDIAFIAAPYADKSGNARGDLGKSACGSLGYAVEDSLYAKYKVLVTDTLVDSVKEPQILGNHIDAILVMDQIGDPNGIVSGTTSITKDPVGVKIARDATKLIETLGLIKNQFSFQSGAGGISLKVTEGIKNLIKKHHIKASFFSGGITQYHVDMLEEGLVEKLYDVQCFDRGAVKSLASNKKHLAISANDYANPNNPNRVIKDLDVVILGAAEVDLDFNVNVTTDSYNLIMGGSGGHSDTSEDAKLAIIVTPLMKARTPIVKDRVNTITTEGKHIDCIVTERGIAINPKRQDLIKQLKDTTLPITTIEALQSMAYKYTGKPTTNNHKGETIGIIQSRHGKPVDTLTKKV